MSVGKKFNRFDTHCWWFATELLQFTPPERRNAGKAEMRELWQLLQEKMNGQNCDLVTVREMYAFQGRMPFTESINCLVCEVADADQPDAAQFWQGR